MLRRSRRAFAQQLPPWYNTFSSDAKAYNTGSKISYDLRVNDPALWYKRPFEFDHQVWNPNTMTESVKRRLCMGDVGKEYTFLGEVFSFPDAEDSPVVNNPQHPARLWWDHSSPTEKVLVQLTPHTPPLLWLGIKPSVAAIKKVFGEFLDADAEHMAKYLPEYEQRQQEIEKQFGAELANDDTNKHRVKEIIMAEMRKKDPRTFELDWEQSHSLFLGTFDNFRAIENRFLYGNAFTFGWPLLVAEGNEFLEDTPVRMSAFRTLLSKSIILLQGRLDLQLDPRRGTLDGAEHGDELVLDVPVFASINYRKNERMCGGSALIQRYNSLMGTQYPTDIPVDVLCALCREETVKSVGQVREEVAFLSKVNETGVDRERHPRLPAYLHASSKVVGQLAYAITYLACMDDDRWVEDIFNRFKDHPEGVVRVGCAKGAMIYNQPQLAVAMAQTEKDEAVRMTIRKLTEEL
eukprot:PhM_4_TR15588/c0_g1_i1/m.80927